MKYSIIVPVYNAEKYLKRCLDSLVNQTYKNFEIIVINDGSRDNSLKILNEYSKKYNFIKLYNKVNTGVADTRNFGISKVTGEYFIFVDSDDYIDENTLEILSKYQDYDVIKFGYNIVDNRNTKKINNIKTGLLSGEEGFIKLCDNKVPFDMPCGYVFSYNYFKKNNFKFKIGKLHEDFGLIPLVILKSSKFISVDNNLYNYYMSENSITRSNNDEKNKQKAYDYLYHFDNLYKEVNGIKNIDNYTKKVFNSYISNALILKVKTLNGINRKAYIKELKKRKVQKLLLSDSLQRKIKKLILNISINLYIIIF